MPRPIHATVHTQALRHNLNRTRQAASDARVWAVVKANAYGHGIARVFEGLRGADGFALLDLDEARTLRDLGWRGPILLLEGAFEPRDLELCSRLDLWHAVHCEEQIDMLSQHKTNTPQRVFLKMNSGMNRLGFAPHSYRSAWTRLSALPQVDEISLMAHFSDADSDNGIAQQMQVFQVHAQDLPGERSLSNSAALLRHGGAAEVRADWVRAGIALYGSAPDHPGHDAAHWGL
ncbi:MAG: alanine racemase, partial [Betaproteobacteria bacterium]